MANFCYLATDLILADKWHLYTSKEKVFYIKVSGVKWYSEG